MPRLLLCAVAFVCLGSLDARACSGQVGATILEDKFEDESGGWDVSPPDLVIKPPEMVISLGPDTTGIAAQNLTFNATDADYCAEFSFQKPASADNTVSFAIEFWASDYANVYAFEVSTNNTAALFRKVQKTWATVFSGLPAPSLKTEPNSVNALRVVAKDGKLTLSVNDALVKVVRAQTPTGPVRFGVFAEVGKGEAGLPPIRVKSYKVTSGQ